MIDCKIYNHKEDQKELESMVFNVIDEYEFPTLTKDDINGISFNPRLKRTLGRANVIKNKIEISKEFWNNNDKEKIIEVIVHELVHLEIGRGHDWRFNMLCRDLGFPKAAGPHTDAKSKPKYIIRCKNCGKEWKRYRKSKLVKEYQSYKCDICNGELELIKEGRE